jgi:hypothetical protein
MSEIICHSCHCREGELHKPGCDVEQCPKCGRQLISCDHSDDFFSDEERVPFIFWPLLCFRCGDSCDRFDMFMVDNDVWNYYTRQPHGNLCWDCFNEIKELVDTRSGNPPRPILHVWWRFGKTRTYKYNPAGLIETFGAGNDCRFPENR